MEKGLVGGKAHAADGGERVAGREWGKSEDPN